MEADRVRRTSAGDRADRRRASAVASSPSSRITTAFTPFIGSKQVRPQADNGNGEPFRLRVGEHLSSSASERGRASAFAGPPVPIVVNRESRAPRSSDHRPSSPSTMARAMRQGSPTPSVTTTSPGRAQDRASLTRRRARRPPAPHTGRHIVEHELPGHAGPWGVPAPDDVGHDGCVRDAEGVAELAREMPCALVDVRLVDGEQPPLRDLLAVSSVAAISVGLCP